MELDNGHTGRYSAYLAYINSEQEYNDITINQNGLNFGARAMYNKGNLYGGVVANVGFNLIDANNMYGDEDFETYTMSLSYKTSYDVDLHDNRYFLQPSMTISYIYAYTTSYMSSGGAKVTSDALHVLNLNPQIKFIAKLDNGYTPYGSIGYNWNLEANGEIRTNNAALPDLSVDPYAEYKFGVTRSFDGSISSFVEAVITSGGRQGYSIQAGIKWNY